MKHPLPIQIFLSNSAELSVKHGLCFIWFFLTVSFFHAFAQVPTITSFSPLVGKQHVLDTITGTNFHINPDSNAVFFGALRAKVIAASSTQLVAEVPLGAISDYIYVTTQRRTAISKRIFRIVYPCGNFVDTAFLKYVNQVSTESGTLIKKNQTVNGDFNDDKAIDLGVVMTNAHSRIYLNNKSYTVSVGSFPAYVSLNDSTGLKSMKQFDINSDGKQDIIILNKTLFKLFVFRNLSHDSVLAFSNPDIITVSNSPEDFDINDFDQDGKMDIVVTFSVLFSGISNSTMILQNISTSANTLAFSAPIIATPATSYTNQKIMTGDFNLDGKPDLIILSTDLIVSIFINTSTSSVLSFAQASVYFPSYYYDLDIGDINSDGKLDLLLLNGDLLSFFINWTTSTTTPTFTQMIGVTRAGSPAATKFIDVNLDGFLDIISCDVVHDNQTKLYLNNQTANPYTQQASTTFLGNLLFMSTVIADLDTNNAPDIITIQNGIQVVKNDYIRATPSILSSDMKIITRKGRTIKFKITKGNGNQRIVIVKKGLPLVMKPAKYTGYAANSTIGMGAQPETDAFVVYRGNNDTIEVNGLQRNTKYYFSIFEVNGYDSGSIYSNSAYTFDTSTIYEVTRQVSNVIVSNISDSSARISWTKGDGNKRLLLIQRDVFGSFCSPKQNKYYGAGAFGKGDTVQSNYFSNNFDSNYLVWFTIYADTGAYFNINGLTSGVTYRLIAFEYLDTLNVPSYFYDSATYHTFITPNYIPRIDSIVPLMAKPGDKIVIYGDYFDQDPNKNRGSFINAQGKAITMAVTFGSVKAETINVINKKIIETIVPYGATNDFIRVTAYHRGDTYATKKFQPYFLSRDSFGSGSLSYVQYLFSNPPYDAFNGFAVLDGNNTGHPRFYFGNFLEAGGSPAYGLPLVASPLAGSYPPACSYWSYESNIDYNLDLTMDALYSCWGAARIILPFTLGGGLSSDVLSYGPTLCNHDFNKDGQFDRLVRDTGLLYGQSIVMFNNQKVLLPIGTPCLAGTLADLNNDNKVDILAGNYNTGKIKIFKNNYDTGAFGVNSFAPLIELSTSPGIEWIECADLDRDGREDFGVTNSLNNTLSIYKNLSTTPLIDSNSFILKAVFNLPERPGRFKFQDFNGDGKIDISINGYIGSTGRMTLLMNQMNNGLIDTTKFRMVLSSIHSFGGDFKLIDQNLDGKPEFYSSPPSSPGVQIFMNSMKLFNINKPNPTTYNPRDSFQVSYNTFGRMFNAGNVARVQLLDSAGNTLISNNLGQKTTTADKDTILVIIPGNTVPGYYRLRIVTTNVVDTSVTSDFCLFVCESYAKPLITSSKALFICSHDSIQFDLTNKISGTYTWYRNDTLITSNTSGPAYFNKPGKYKAILITSSGCRRISNDTMLNSFSNSLSGLSLSRAATFCKGDSTQISVISTHNSFKTQWYKNSIALIADTFPGVKVRNTGLFKAVIIDTNLCSWTSNTLSINANEYSVKLNINGSSSICQGDSAVLLTDSNGYSGLKYQWFKNNSLMNDSSKQLRIKSLGTYRFKAINNNGCVEYSQDTSVIVKSLPSVNFTSNKSLNNICTDDSLTFSVNSALSKYSWYRNALLLVKDTIYTLTVKTSGAYHVSVMDSNGCGNFTKDTVVNYVNKRNLVLQLSKSQGLCSGDSVNIFVNPNSAYKSYLWFKDNSPRLSDTSSALVVKQSGLYSLRIVDTFSCAYKSNDTNVTVFPTPQVSLIINGPNPFCYNDSCLITYNSVSKNTYHLYRNDTLFQNNSSMIIVKATGSYYITVMDTNNCSNKSNSLALQCIPQAAAPMIRYQNDTLFSSVTSGNQWMRNDTPLVSGYLPFYIPVVNGSYTLRYTDTNGCLSFTSTPFIFSATGIIDKFSGSNDFIQISPNPFENAFSIYCKCLNLENEPLTFNVYDNVGKLILHKEGKSSSYSTEIDMSSFAAGAYHVIVSTAYSTKSYKLIKVVNH